MNKNTEPSESGSSHVEVPPEARAMADAVSAEYERRQRQEAESQERASNEIAEKARAEMRDLVGAKNWNAFRQLMRRERLTLRDRMQPPEGPSRDFGEENRARKERVNAFLQRLGVSPGRLREIATAHFGQVRDLYHRSPRKFTEAYTLRTHAGMLKDWLGGVVTAPDPHRWFVFRPPFDGGQMGFGIPARTRAYRVAVNRQVAMDLDAGLVGHTLTLDIIDASDLDVAHGIADTQVEFWFEAPTAGLVEVVIEAQSGLAVHELRTEDEWGVSSSSTEQSNFLMMHVLHPNVTGPSFALMSRFLWDTDGTDFVQREFLVRGGDFFARLFGDGPVPAFQWVVIRAGTRSDDATMTNDLEIHSKSMFQWFIKAVHVRIAP